MGGKLFVGNLDFSAQDEDLKDLFAPFGSVLSARVLMDRDTGRPRGFGFVEFQNPKEAREAIQMLDGRDFRGRGLRVNEAQDRACDNRRPNNGPPARRTERW